MTFGLTLGGADWPGGAERRNSAVSDGFRHRGAEMGGRRTCWCNGECSGWAVVQVIYRQRREVKEKRLGVVPILRALESTANSPCFYFCKVGESSEVCDEKGGLKRIIFNS